MDDLPCNIYYIPYAICYHLYNILYTIGLYNMLYANIASQPLGWQVGPDRRIARHSGLSLLGGFWKIRGSFVCWWFCSLPERLIGILLRGASFVRPMRGQKATCELSLDVLVLKGPIPIREILVFWGPCSGADSECLAHGASSAGDCCGWGHQLYNGLWVASLPLKTRRGLREILSSQFLGLLVHALVNWWMALTWEIVQGTSTSASGQWRLDRERPLEAWLQIIGCPE